MEYPYVNRWSSQTSASSRIISLLPLVLLLPLHAFAPNQMMRPAGAMMSSSPGREKLPAPGLARILAGSGSRSRGRTAARSSPLFNSRSKSVGRSSAATHASIAAAAGEEGEPTSPKVTCIGQVRIRNKKSSAPPPPKLPPQSKVPRPCQCFHKALLYSLFPGRKKSKSGWLSWRSWSRSGGYQRREPDSPGRPPLEFIVIRGDDDGDFASAQPPPKDALLLMRCRSAPHNRAASLAATARCAVSPLPQHEPQKPAAASEEAEKGARVEIRRRRKKGNERRTQLAAVEMSEDEEDEGTGSESQRPLVLTRCRSEPARRRRVA